MLASKSMELFIEYGYQASSLSYVMAPPPSPSPHSHHQVVSLSQSSCESPVELSVSTGIREEGVGEEPNNTTAIKPGPL